MKPSKIYTKYVILYHSISDLLFMVYVNKEGETMFWCWDDAESKCLVGSVNYCAHYFEACDLLEGE